MPDKNIKRFLHGIVKEVAEDGSLAVAIATDQSIDRMDEVIEAGAWDVKDFQKNPVLLWAHNYSEEPIGRVEDLRQEGDKMLFRPKFAIDISDKAKRIYKLFKAGVLNAFSVGFIPDDWETREVSGQKVRVFTKVRLLEISAVPVPANPNALVQVRGMGDDIPEDLREEIMKAAEKEGVQEKPEDDPKDDAPAEEEPKDGDEKILNAIGEMKKELSEQLAEGINSLKTIAARESGTDDPGKGEPGVKVEGSDTEVAVSQIAKRALQEINKASGKGLRDLKKVK